MHIFYYEKPLNVLENDSLILNPHDGDVFLLEKASRIILKAKTKVKWFVNGSFIGEGDEEIFAPTNAGIINIKAESVNGQKEKITIYIKGED